MSSIGTLLADASYYPDLVVSRIIIQIVFQHFQEARVGPRFCKKADHGQLTCMHSERMQFLQV